MEVLGLQPEWAVLKGYVEGIHNGKRPSLA